VVAGLHEDREGTLAGGQLRRPEPHVVAREHSAVDDPSHRIGGLVDTQSLANLSERERDERRGTLTIRVRSGL
jgi:hypothetical protein